jgi:CheY-like chemotaxis protein
MLAAALAADSPAEVASQAKNALASFYSNTPTTEQALALLLHKGKQSLDFVRHPERHLKAELDPTPLVWQWDDAKRKLTSSRVTPMVAELVAAVQALSDARRIAPNNPDVRRANLAAVAEAIGYAGDSPIVAARIGQAGNALANASILELQDLLSFTLAEDRPAAAVVVVRQLGESQNVDLLYSHNPQASALVRALAHPSRELRFAALEAIMRLDPRSPYPGAGTVAETLEYFARSTGAPRALVASADATEAGRLAGLLAEQGYEPDIAVDGAGMLRMARAAGDYEVIMVDSALALPSSAQLLQRLRGDSRLARIPLAVVSLADEYPQVERVARRYPSCLAVMRVHNGAGMQFELNRLLRAAGRGVVPGDVRRAEGVKALEWIARLASERQQVYDIRRLDQAVIASLDAPGMTQAAIPALARLDTARSQRALVDLASRPTAPLPLRRAAAHAFADSVARRGTLLTSDEIQRQYDRYNGSEKYDADTQQVMASLLNTIEARAQADWLALEENESPAS